MLKKCKVSDVEFEVRGDDLLFYLRVAPLIAGARCEIPAPEISPLERQRQRLAWRNAHHLYRRSCALTGESMIAAYPPQSPFVVYSPAAWWSDRWDAINYGAPFDFTRPFFDQFRNLQLRTPRPALMNSDSENSEYCNYAGRNKNCLMANAGSWFNQGCLYGEGFLRCTDSLDCAFVENCELCCEVVGGVDLYNCAFADDCCNCADCCFSLNLRGCRNCMFCANLRNKTNYLWNKPAPPEELAEARRGMRSAAGLEALLAQYRQLRLQSIHPAVHQTNCENCSGDYLTNCKNVNWSFTCNDTEDGKYLLHCGEAKDVWDCCHTGYQGTELFYETVNAGIGGQRNLFCSGNWSCSDIMYCDTMMSCSDCFGCISLRRKQYCILNRQYRKDEYERMLPRVIDHMRATGEWGAFFPPRLAPFAYNESNGMDYSPLSRDEACRRGFVWLDETRDEPHAAPVELPEALDDADDRIPEKVFRCAESGKLYKITAPELERRRKLGIALPRFAPAVRHRKRMQRRNPAMLWPRRCPACGVSVLSSFSPDRPEKIYSLDCYDSQLD